MKKLIGGLLAALLMTVGLVAYSGAAATAAACDKYDTCIDTKTTVSADPNNKTNKATIKVVVDAKQSNATPTGKVEVVVKKKGTSKVVFKDTKNLDGDAKITFTTGKLASAKYVVGAVYTEKSGSKFNGSDDTGSFTIK